MVVQDPMVKGGIAAVVNGYRGSHIESDYNIIYVESYKDGGKVTKLLKGIKGYLHFAKVLLIDKPELVQIHSSFGASFYRKLPFIYMASWAKHPIINHIHGADFEKFYANAGEKKKKLIKKVYEKCAILVALSSEWKRCLAQVVPEEKICVIENYSILHEDALKNRLTRKSNSTVLFLGELGKRKGCYDIPAVVEKVVKVVPRVRFMLCGAGSPEDEAAIKKLIEGKGLGNNIIFPGWLRDTAKDKVLRDADVFFLPSYNEGMPMSVLDAMGYGLPIVSTNVGGISKILHDGENGICCNAGDINGFAQGIIRLLNDKKTCEMFGKESFSIVKKGYSLQSHLKSIEELYNRLLMEI
ncbi:glycosyltransferase involved in cell wall biosynthesis [Youngiibacter multivorans]|uniref:Glycosyltransferase involved in cell wall biosynthesis n=2 Tax=Youngiibacter multivorans TaxID=937251 RepID=A0ABS4G6E4_9CLOT|nr:glycosyltransferase involved in cell wall biosynthesis [Youngiibacter multivorans]